MKKKIICIYAPGNGGKCNSEICDHRLPHDENQFPEDGGCRWAKDPHCVPAVLQEIKSILNKYFGDEDGGGYYLDDATKDLAVLFKEVRV